MVYKVSLKWSILNLIDYLNLYWSFYMKNWIGFYYVLIWNNNWWERKEKISKGFILKMFVLLEVWKFLVDFKVDNFCFIVLILKVVWF